MGVPLFTCVLFSFYKNNTTVIAQYNRKKERKKNREKVCLKDVIYGYGYEREKERQFEKHFKISRFCLN